MQYWDDKAGERIDEVLLNPKFSNKEKRERLAVDLGNNIYAAAWLYEALEYKGVILGNGHHIRQKLVAMAEELFNERWIDDGVDEYIKREKGEEKNEV